MAAVARGGTSSIQWGSRLAEVGSSLDTARGGRSTQLTRQPGHYHAPRYSPDGESIVFEITEGGRLTSPDWSIATGVFLIPADGVGRSGAARQVTRNGGNPHFGARNDRLFVTGKLWPKLFEIELVAEE